MSAPATPETRIGRLYTAFNEQLGELDAFPQDMSPTSKRKRQRFFDNLRERLSRTGGDINKMVAPTIERPEQPDEEEEEEEEEEIKSEALKLWDGVDWDASVNNSSDFTETLLAFPYTGALATVEVQAFNRLIVGYKDTEPRWTRNLSALVCTRDTWTAVCIRARALDSIHDDAEHLLALSAFSLSQSNVSATEAFIDHVVRTIHALIYVSIWAEHDNKGHAGRQWKSNMIQRIFTRDNGKLTKDGKKRLEIFRRRHEREIDAKRVLLKVYKHFGPNIFFDRFWDLNVRRSKSFKELVDMLCDASENVETSFVDSSDALYRILFTFSGTLDVHSLLRDFMFAYPPLTALDYTWDKL